jgi:hypothetical protein
MKMKRTQQEILLDEILLLHNAIWYYHQTNKKSLWTKEEILQEIQASIQSLSSFGYYYKYVVINEKVLLELK